MPEKRLLSLDALRGLAVAGMILVSAPGNDDASPLLRHSQWHGCTPADLVFPVFLFALGVSAALALARHLEEGVPRRTLLRRAAARAALLFVFGLAGNGLPAFFDPDLWRVMGVLQRIGLCYLGAAILFLKTRARTQTVLAASLLLGYWALLGLAPSPGHAAGDLTPGGNLVSWFDRLLLPGRLFGGSYDPEGLLSTLPAFATTIAGLLVGRFLLAGRPKVRTSWILAGAGAALVAGGLAWSAAFPINKHLWTSSFGAFATGMALCLFAVLHWALEVRAWRRWCVPLAAYGRNAFLVYVLSFLFLVLQDSIVMGPETLRYWLCKRLFGFAAPEQASFLYAASYTALWLPLVGWLYQKRIAIKASWSAPLPRARTPRMRKAVRARSRAGRDGRAGPLRRDRAGSSPNWKEALQGR